MFDFQTIPILDYASTNRDEFVSQLRHAFTNVGFCYLKNPPIDKADIESVIAYAPQLFDIDQAEKERIRMVNSPHFLGYNRLGSEFTRGAIDQREQFDFATPHVCRWRPGDEDYTRLWGEAQWPNEEALPGFRETFLHYLAQLEKFSFEFIELLGEALLLPPGSFDQYYENPKGAMQHRCKVVKYPVLGPAKGTQGVGPHFDAGFLTFLLQASPHKGLQVQNFSGQWIDVEPIENTLVVNIGKGLETVTHGVARATSHRVVSPSGDSGPRYSLPFFQNIRQGIRLNDHKLPLPQEILDLKRSRGDAGLTESVNFSEYTRECAGLASLINRIKSHPDVGHRHYPERYRMIFGTDQLVGYGGY